MAYAECRGASSVSHSQTGTEFIPQAGLAFHLPEAAEIKAMVSKGFRNPTIREMYMFPPQNPDLKPERLWKYELSFSQRLLENRLSYGANVFYINGDDLIIRLPNPSGSGMLNQNSGKIENWGAEANIGYQFNPVWGVTANYSWLHMENPVLASPEHKLYGGVNFRKGTLERIFGHPVCTRIYTDLDAETKESLVFMGCAGQLQRLPATLITMYVAKNYYSATLQNNSQLCIAESNFMSRCAPLGVAFFSPTVPLNIVGDPTVISSLAANE